MRWLTLVIVLTLSGCIKPTLLVKPGGTQESFNQDKLECEYDAAKATAGIPYTGSINVTMKRSELTRACMAVRGWHPQEG